MTMHAPCSCSSCSDLIARRGFLRLAGLGAVGAALAPIGAWAQQTKPTYEAMLLSCIDPRIIDPVHNYMTKNQLDGRYSQFIFAGAAVGVSAPIFSAWHETFWENLQVSLDLHGIKRLIAINHRDCGAARTAYGPGSIGTPAAETETHRWVLTAFKEEAQRRQPHLQRIDGYLMALDGSVELLTA